MKAKSHYHIYVPFGDIDFSRIVSEAVQDVPTVRAITVTTRYNSFDETYRVCTLLRDDVIFRNIGHSLAGSMILNSYWGHDNGYFINEHRQGPLPSRWRLDTAIIRNLTRYYAELSDALRRTDLGETKEPTAIVHLFTSEFSPGKGNQKV